MKSVILTEAYGGYFKVAKNIIERLGLQVLTLDEGPTKANDSDFCNFESIMHLSKDEYAVWALGERSIREIVRLGVENFPNPIFTTMIDIMTYTDKVKCRRLLPPESAFIRYPKIFDTSSMNKVVIKKRIGAGANYTNGRMFVADLQDTHYIAEYIEHDKELMIIVQYSKGKLVDWIPYVAFVDDDRNVMRPYELPELDIGEDSFKRLMTEWLAKLGIENNIDGVIDVGFMFKVNGSELWFIESNPRVNREAYNIARPLVFKFLCDRLPKSFLPNNYEELTKYENTRPTYCKGL